jgi:general secretion pathway protein F
MPRFAAVLDGLGQSLPPFTRAVILVADVGRQLAVPGAIGAGLAVALGHEAVARPRGRRWLHRFLLGVPGIGSVRHAAGTARLASALAALLESGVPLRRGLRDAGPTVGDAELLIRLDDARSRIDSGERLGQAFASAGVFTPLAARLVAAGEQSGRLVGMLTFAARMEQNRAERIVRTAVRLLEPLLILLFAGVVAAVAAAMLQAVYAVRPS